MDTALGRGGDGRIKFFESYVAKRTTPWEAEFMAAHPHVFANVVSIVPHESSEVVMTMPRFVDVAGIDRERALFEGLNRLTLLWNVATKEVPNWRGRLLAHLLETSTVAPELLKSLVRVLPVERAPSLIHGDPTLANLLQDPSTGRFLWIDPLKRDYIPPDPLVDVGKMLQSCYDYERVLKGSDAPRFDSVLARKLVLRAFKGGFIPYDYAGAVAWMWIHIVRLLPYQDARVRGIYERELEKSSGDAVKR